MGRAIVLGIISISTVVVKAATPAAVVPTVVVKAATPAAVVPTVIVKAATPAAVVPTVVVKAATPAAVVPAAVVKAATPSIVVPASVVKAAAPSIVVPAAVVKPASITHGIVLVHISGGRIAQSIQSGEARVSGRHGRLQLNPFFGLATSMGGLPVLQGSKPGVPRRNRRFELNTLLRFTTDGNLIAVAEGSKASGIDRGHRLKHGIFLHPARVLARQHWRWRHITCGFQGSEARVSRGLRLFKDRGFVPGFTPAKRSTTIPRIFQGRPSSQSRLSFGGTIATCLFGRVVGRRSTTHGRAGPTRRSVHDAGGRTVPIFVTR
jgi:hypothetical protein